MTEIFKIRNLHYYNYGIYLKKSFKKIFDELERLKEEELESKKD